MKKPIASFLSDTHLKEENLQLNHSIFKQAIEITKNLGLKEIYHLGDIFDSRKSQTIELLKDGFFDILEIFKNEEIKLITIPGNHDKTDYLSIHSFLSTFQYHPSFHLIETHFTFLINMTDEGEGIILHLLPFFEDTIYNHYLKELHEEQYNVDFINILGTHIGLSGAIMNNGIEVHSDVDNSYIKSFDKVIVGHYHDAQEYDNIHYIGSSFQHNFGEKPNKGLTVLYDDLSTELIPLDFPKYTTLFISVKELTNSDLNDLKEEKLTGDSIRVMLEGTAEEVNAFNKQDLLKIGIKVEKKTEKIKKEDLQKKVEKYDNNNIKDCFSDFCSSNTLIEPEGLIYLNQI